ncbi:unnamed protein product [Closterium sp. Naga37s-1]|nr:unnamed protein product [Closterium sp. Naga37s-1]
MSPPFSPSLHLLAACVLALLAAAVANAGGVGGGGLFVPLFNLLLGYDAKSATALSKGTTTAIINPLRSTPSPLPIPLSLPSLHPPGPIYPPPSLSPPNLPIPLRMFGHFVGPHSLLHTPPANLPFVLLYLLPPYPKLSPANHALTPTRSRPSPFLPALVLFFPSSYSPSPPTPRLLPIHPQYPSPPNTHFLQYPFSGSHDHGCTHTRTDPFPRAPPLSLALPPSAFFVLVASSPTRFPLPLPSTPSLLPPSSSPLPSPPSLLPPPSTLLPFPFSPIPPPPSLLSAHTPVTTRGGTVDAAHATTGHQHGHHMQRCMAGKAAQRAVAMMVTEAHMAAVCLHGSYGAHHTTPLSLTIPWLLEAPSSMAHPSLSAAPPGALIATHTLHQQPLPSHAKATQSFWWPVLVRAACASQHLGVSAKAREEKEQEESHEPLLSASPAAALEAVASVPPVSPVPPAPPASAAAALQEPSERGPAAATPAAAPAIRAPGATSDAAQSGQQHAGSAVTTTAGSFDSGGSDCSGDSRGWWEQKRVSGGCAVPLESPVSDACCSGVDQQPGGCCVHAGTCCCHAACEEGYAGSADYGGGESETGKGKRHRTWSAGHVLKPFVFRFACGATARLSACDVECVWEMVAVWSAFVALQVAKTRVAACSAVYWLLDLLQLPVALVATAAVSARRDFAPSLPHSHSHCHQHHSTPPLHTTYAHEHHQPTPTSCSPCQPSTNAPTPSPASSPVSPLLTSLSTPGYSTFHSPPPYPPHMQAAWSHGSSIAHTAYTHTRSNSSGSSSSVWGAGAGAWGREVWVYPLSALLAGCMGGLLGVGGGMVMGPVLLELGMLPQVSSATSSFIVLFSSSLSVLEFYLLGRIPIPPALLFSLIAALAALLGLSTIRALVVRSGRTSLIVLFLSLVIAASAVLLGALGVMRIRSDWESGAPMGFRPFCGETW